MQPTAAEPRIEMATPALAGDVYDFLAPHHYINPDLDRTAFMECWRHQFFGDGGPACVYVAHDSAGRLIAHYGVMAMPYAAAGARLRGGFACQLFLDPAWRKTPLFFTLERRLLREYGDFGFDFLYGLVTIKPVLTAHVALGFARGPDLYIYVSPLVPGGAVAALQPWSRFLSPAIDRIARSLSRAALFNNPGAAGDLRIEQITNFADLDPAVADRSLASFDMSADRGREPFQARLQPFGGKRYSVFAAVRGRQHAGYVVVRRTRVRDFDACVIVDLLAPAADEAARHALLRHACMFGLDAGCHAAVMLARPSQADALLLENHCFFRTSSSFTLIHHIPEPLRARLSAAISNRWYLSWFDHDYT
jgi:hypothetical protein